MTDAAGQGAEAPLKPSSEDDLPKAAGPDRFSASGWKSKQFPPEELGRTAGEGGDDLAPPRGSPVGRLGSNSPSARSPADVATERPVKPALQARHTSSPTIEAERMGRGRTRGLVWRGSNNFRMHSRSRFFGRTLDFAQMAETCPYLSPFLVPLPGRRKRKLGELPEDEAADSCRYTFDFKTTDAQRLLAKATFKCLYGVEFFLPSDGTLLVPTLPSRANYIHFLADLLSDSEGAEHFSSARTCMPSAEPPRGEAVCVLDVGVGGNCVYPLLGASEYGWSFVGSDVERGALKVCFQNIARNGLQDRIALRMQRDPSRVFNGVVREGEIFAASVCNPPFYDERPDASSQRLESCPFRDRGGALHELTCEGGETGFVERMLGESRLFCINFVWFSTLVARATTRDALKSKLHEGMRRVTKAQTERMQKYLEAIVDRLHRQPPRQVRESQRECPVQWSVNRAQTTELQPTSRGQESSSESLTADEEQYLETQLAWDSHYAGQALEAWPREIRIFDLWQGRQTRWVVCWTFWSAEQRKTLKRTLFTAR